MVTSRCYRWTNEGVSRTKSQALAPPYLAHIVYLAGAFIIAAIIGDCGAIGIVAYRWFVFSEAPGTKTWSSLIALTAFIAVALIQTRDVSKE